jgi:uncharacterized membrane protein
MRDQVPAAALETLVRIGMTHLGQQMDDLLATVNQWEFINRLPWSAWNPVLEPLSVLEHEAAAKGVVNAEERHRWCGGSVAAAIWVYRSFAQKFPAQANALAEWMLANSNNEWVPFGSNRGSARTIQEHLDLLERRAARRRCSAEERIDQQELKAEKTIARLQTAKDLDLAQRARSETRSLLIAELKDLPVKKRLEHLACDDQRPLYYYPVELADGASVVWHELDEQIRQRLTARAAAMPPGPWKQWLKQLHFETT